MKIIITALLVSYLIILTASTNALEMSKDINKDYQQHLAPLWDHLHRNPELSLMENKTAARLAKEIRDVGFEVTEGVGGTGIVGLLKNGPGPMIMVRADMDGLPVIELSGLTNALKVKMKDWNGAGVGEMHACVVTMYT